ncbi:MAG: hypothetical protein ACK56F_18215 [bacterium]
MRGRSQQVARSLLHVIDRLSRLLRITKHGRHCLAAIGLIGLRSSVSGQHPRVARGLLDRFRRLAALITTRQSQQ